MAGNLYVTRDNIQEKVQGWLGSLPVRRKWDTVPNWSNSALLVIDMQNVFVHPDSPSYLPGAQAVAPNINRLAEEFYGNDSSIIYTRHVQEEGDEGVMDEWWGDIIREGKQAELWDGLSVMGDVITKPRYSAFHRTELDHMLTGVENLFITGVLTDICCETTARHGFVKDYRVFVVADGCATVTEELHTSSLASLSYGFAEILSWREVLQRLR